MINDKCSVIIPCFNAEKWIAEAIDSLLAQTYPNLEIIVIDDGSSDRSLEIVKSYGDRLIYRRILNQGANTARNLGFTLATGRYIQYLDADDYLLPDKIAKQVACLQNTGADFVYGDWRYQHHSNNGDVYLDEIRVCGDKDDFLYSLLANDRWSNLAPILFSRSIVSKVSWDESLSAAQDRDFLFSVMVAGAKGIYQSGCDSIYRMHSGTSISTASKLRWFKSHCLIMEKAEQILQSQGLFSAKYQQALAKAYWEMGKEYLYSSCGDNQQHQKSDRQEIQYQTYARILNKVNQLSPNIFIQHKSKLYTACHHLLGYQLAERLSYIFNYYKTIIINY
ncbi:MAG: glycosyltransferase [Cyanobacteria bacterium J06600_6]